MREKDASNRILRSVLLSNNNLTAVVSQRIYQDRAPQNAVFPYIIFARIGGMETSYVSLLDRALFQPRYQVNAVTKGGDQTSAYTIDHELDEALRLSVNQSITLDREYLVQGIWRVGNIDYSELDAAGTQFNYVGGEYDMFMSYP